jgi:hypothetical protein
MSAQHERPWPAIDLAELRYGLAFVSSVEEMPDFLHRDVEEMFDTRSPTRRGERQACGRIRISR